MLQSHGSHNPRTTGLKHRLCKCSVPSCGSRSCFSSSLLFLQFSIVHVTLYDRDELINFPLSIHWMKDVGPNKPLAGCWYHLPFPSLLFLINRGIIRQISPVKFVWLQGKIITTLFGGWQVQFTSIESHLSGPGFLLQQVWVLNYNFKC